MMSSMARLVTVDEKGRIVLPDDVRKEAGIKPKSKLLVEAHGEGVLELRDYDLLLEEVHKVAAKKLSGWREDEHTKEKLLMRLVRDSRNAKTKR